MYARVVFCVKQGGQDKNEKSGSINYDNCHGCINSDILWKCCLCRHLTVIQHNNLYGADIQLTFDPYLFDLVLLVRNYGQPRP